MMSLWQRLPAAGSVFAHVFDHADPPRAWPASCLELGAAQVDEVAALHQLATADLPADFVRRDQAAFFSAVLASGGKIIGISAAGRLIAYAVLSLPAERRPAGAAAPGTISGTTAGTTAGTFSGAAYGGLLGLPPAEWSLLACLDGVAVHPDWRGNALHHYLTAWRVALARALGCRYVCATAAPANDTSWGALLQVGLRIRALGDFYGGQSRYVACVDLLQPQLIFPDPATSLCVAAADTARIGELLDSGYLGWRRLKYGSRPAHMVLGRA